MKQYFLPGDIVGLFDDGEMHRLVPNGGYYYCCDLMWYGGGQAEVRLKNEGKLIGLTLQSIGVEREGRFVEGPDSYGHGPQKGEAELCTKCPKQIACLTYTGKREASDRPSAKIDMLWRSP